MLASDGHPYVVKFQNNPQHIRVLANELLATRLAGAIGLSVPACEVVEVTEWLIQNSKELNLDFGQNQELCRAGLQFGSRLIGGLMPGQVADYLPEDRLAEVKNLDEFAGMLVIDKWTCNSNGRQAVFYKRPKERRYTAAFIDQGYCFNAGEWKFVDAPLRGVYARNLVYRGVIGWKSFEPWLSRAQELDPQKIWSIAETIPPEWYGGDLGEIEILIERLLSRRQRIQELITLFRESSREPFPNWMKPSSLIQERQFPEPGWVDTVHGPIM
jgi:hypothetical protein